MNYLSAFKNYIIKTLGLSESMTDAEVHQSMIDSEEKVAERNNLEKMVSERDAKISEYETRISILEADLKKFEATIAERDLKIVDLSSIPVATPAIADFKSSSEADKQDPILVEYCPSPRFR